MREEIAVLQRALNDARADAAAQHAHSDHEAADHSALIAVQAKLDALSAEFRAPPAQARQHRRSSFSAMKRDLELLKRKRRVSDASPSASPLRSDASESERRCANQPPVLKLLSSVESKSTSRFLSLGSPRSAQEVASKPSNTRILNI